MKNDFKIIVITSPEPVEGEAKKITALLEAGIDYVHIRKPEASSRDIKNLIEDIPYRYRSQLRLHGHFHLFDEFNLAGAHLNSRCPHAPATAVSITRSCHTEKELEHTENFEYVTISPVFNSISKKGYTQRFDLDSLERIAGYGKIVALGGVTPDKLNFLKEKGFYGAALLGYIWNNDFNKALKELQEFIIHEKTSF